MVCSNACVVRNGLIAMAMQPCINASIQHACVLQGWAVAVGTDLAILGEGQVLHDCRRHADVAVGHPSVAEHRHRRKAARRRIRALLDVVHLALLQLVRLGQGLVDEDCDGEGGREGATRQLERQVQVRPAPGLQMGVI